MEEQMKRSIHKGSCTADYREAAVRRVMQAVRALTQVARSLEISHKTLADWVRRARRAGSDPAHHSDRGAQYCAGSYRQELADQGIVAPMSRRANGYDNAPMDSANGTLKVERVCVRGADAQRP
jgi:transposase InsO family protein